MKEIKKLEPFFNEWEVCASLEKTGYGGMYIIKNKYTSEPSILNHISVPRDDSNLNAARKWVSGEEELDTYFEKNKNLIVDEIEYAISLNESDYIFKTYEYEVRKKENKIGWDIFVRLEDLRKVTELKDKNDIIKMGIDICTALEYCQSKGVVHRNITPDAIYFASDGKFKLGNFKLFDPAVAKKTNINYVSPEFNNGEETDIQTDIYSLGIVLFQFLNDGALPFVQLGEKNEIVIRHAAMDRLKGKRMQPPKNADPTLARIVLSACKVDKEDRYKTPTEFKEDLTATWDKQKPIGVADEEEIKNQADDELDRLEKMLNDDLEAMGLGDIMSELSDEIKEAENKSEAEKEIDFSDIRETNKFETKEFPEPQNITGMQSQAVTEQQSFTGMQNQAVTEPQAITEPQNFGREQNFETNIKVGVPPIRKEVFVPKEEVREEQNEKEKKKSNVFLPIIIVVVGIIAVIAVFAFGNKDEKVNSDLKTEEITDVDDKSIYEEATEETSEEISEEFSEEESEKIEETQVTTVEETVNTTIEQTTTQQTTVVEKATQATTKKEQPKQQPTTKKQEKKQEKKQQPTTKKQEPVTTQPTTVAQAQTQAPAPAKKTAPPPNSPSPSHDTGNYSEAFDVSIYAEPNCTIYYTTSGADVTVQTRKRYYKPIPINKTTYLKIIAVNADGVESEQVQFKYTF